MACATSNVGVHHTWMYLYCLHQATLSNNKDYGKEPGSSTHNGKELKLFSHPNSMGISEITQEA